MGRREEALEQYRELSGKNRDAYLPDLARSLGTYGSILKMSDQNELTMEAFSEGVELFNPYFARMPAAFYDLLLFLVRAYLAAAEEAEKPAEEALLGPLAEFLKEQKSDETS